jgi:site-specific DNA-methyltransferase (adenine-specific)
MRLIKLPIDKIVNGNCLHVLPTFPEKSVDLVFADPPYNLQLEKELWRPNSTRVNGVEDTWDQFSDFEAYDRFTKGWLIECRRVLKDTGTIWVIGSYHNIFRVGRIMQDLGFWILNDIVWVKNNPMPNFHGVRFTNAHETLIWAQKNKGNRYTFNYQTMKSLNINNNENCGLQMRSDWKLPICTGKERIKINGEKAHPTQKPEALLHRVILSSSNPGDIVLDPFFGSGTTGAVAKKYGRHWIGIESDTAYVSIAQQRVDAVIPNLIEVDAHNHEINNKVRRIPFQALLQRGYIKEGQFLYFGKQGDKKAIVLADGQIKYDGLSGSIHKVGREIQKAPCNGWLAWYYINQETGKREPVDSIRQKVRSDMKLNGKKE